MYVCIFIKDIWGLNQNWKIDPDFCLSSSNEDFGPSKHPTGDMDIDQCKYECIVHSKCSAFEWYENSNSIRCYMILTGTPAVNGSSVSDPTVTSRLSRQTKPQDSSCHIKPTTGRTNIGKIWLLFPS
jgi:hypothetical protein